MKRIILALLIIMSIAFVSASGAFTSLSTDRIAEINVASDSDALLALAPCTGSGDNGNYFVDTDGDGAYELRITTENGVNVDTDLTIKNIFTISNNSTRSITVTLTDNGTYSDRTDFGAVENGVLLNIGESLTVSLTINTDGLAAGVTLIDSITINAQ
ncbi:MAG TPA: hypothetical protein PK718_05165 [Candidatus Methanofastidiosa archaeon]|nr:hypothetical protein [Candidatus Methanofastidiosa archaeon]HPR41921.1 hypothetical protein [Candidatus Methanofastidiosa archaeon]